MVKQDINVVAKMTDGVTKPAKKIKRGLAELDGRQELLARGAAKYGKTVGQLSGELQRQGVYIDKTGRAMSVTTGKFLKTKDAIRSAAKNIKEFRMELLGTLFFGMMLQKMFLGLARSAVDSFMKITEGQTAAAQAITRLSGAWQFLKFSIGDALATALMPFMDTIVGIIDKVADWIEQNPKLVATILIVGAAVGTILMAFGALGLGITSTIQAFGFLGKAFTAFTGLLAAHPIILIIMGIIAAVLLLYTLWTNNWFNIRQVTGVVIKGIANVFFYLTEAGQLLWDFMNRMWIGILNIVHYAAQPIIDALNAIGGAYAFLTGQEFTAMKNPLKQHIIDQTIALDEWNREYDAWQRKAGQGIFSFGENIELSGQRMNRELGLGPGEINMPKSVGMSAMEIIKTGVNIGEMIVNVDGGNTISDSVENAANEGLKEAYANSGGTNQIGGGTGI